MRVIGVNWPSRQQTHYVGSNGEAAEACLLMQSAKELSGGVMWLRLSRRYRVLPAYCQATRGGKGRSVSVCSHRGQGKPADLKTDYTYKTKQKKKNEISKKLESQRGGTSAVTLKQTTHGLCCKWKRRQHDLEPRVPALICPRVDGWSCTRTAEGKLWPAFNIQPPNASSFVK